MDEYQKLGNKLARADMVLMIGIAGMLLGLAVTRVRRSRPKCIWMVVTAALIELLAMGVNHWLVPAFVPQLEAQLVANPAIASVIPPLISLVNDVLHALAVILLALAIVGTTDKRAQKGDTAV